MKTITIEAVGWRYIIEGPNHITKDMVMFESADQVVEQIGCHVKIEEIETGKVLYDRFPQNWETIK